MKLTLLLALTTGALAQDLTQEERWGTVLAVHHAQEYPLARMLFGIPYELTVTGQAQDEELRARIIELSMAVTPIVESDVIPEPVLRVRPVQLRTTQPRAIAYFSPGPNVGKGFYQWLLKACNQSDDLSLDLDSGWIEMALAANGIALQDIAEAKISNELQRNKSKPIIGTQIVQGIATGATGLMAMKIVAASGPWGAGAYGLSLVAGLLVNHFKGTSPKEFSERFSGTIFLDGSYTLPPRGCTPRLTIFSKTKRGASPMGNVPIY